MLFFLPSPRIKNCKPSPYVTASLHSCWRWADDLTSADALVGLRLLRRSLYPHAQRVQNIFSITFLGSTESSQGKTNVQAVYPEISYPCPSASPGSFKANNQTEHDCLRNLWNRVPQRAGWFQRAAEQSEELITCLTQTIAWSHTSVWAGGLKWNRCTRVVIYSVRSDLTGSATASRQQRKQQVNSTFGESRRFALLARQFDQTEQTPFSQSHSVFFTVLKCNLISFTQTYFV